MGTTTAHNLSHFAVLHHRILRGTLPPIVPHLNLRFSAVLALTVVARVIFD